MVVIEWYPSKRTDLVGSQFCLWACWFRQDRTLRKSGPSANCNPETLWQQTAPAEDCSNL